MEGCAMKRVQLYLLAFLLPLCVPAEANYYEPGPPPANSAPWLSSLGYGQSNYCQVGAYRMIDSPAYFDHDDEYDDFGFPVGYVEEMAYPAIRLEGPGTLSADQTRYDAPLHERGSVSIIRTTDDYPIYADDPPSSASTTLVLGPARIEVRALGYQGWVPQGW